MNHTTGDRIRSVRKRRGMTQKELADASGLSKSFISKMEQGDDAAGSPRVETLRRIAAALSVTTSTLLNRGDADQAHPETVEDWQDVRDALFGRLPQPEDEPTAAGVTGVLRSVRPALAANRFSEVHVILPGLIRDARVLNGHGEGMRPKVLNLTSWLLTQTRQWDAAEVAAVQAADAAQDRLDVAAAVNTQCWSLLRQGRLAEARDMAQREADEIEPRFSRATVAELAMWGRLLLGVVNAAVRDNRPGEAASVLSLARAAADRIGREVASDMSTTRTFGPTSVMMIAAENAAITRRPDKVLQIAREVPADVLFPESASRRRHQLDVTSAYVMLRRYPEARSMLRMLWHEAPEWLAQQRYARDIMRTMFEQRRTLTSEMRDLAAAIHLPL